MGDWLGTGTIAPHLPRLRQYRSFADARAFVRGLGLKSGARVEGILQVRQELADIPAVQSKNSASLKRQH